MEPQDKELKQYELGYLVAQEADASAVTSLVSRHQGEVVQESAGRSVALSYPIKKQKHAIFGSLRFRSNPENVPTLEHDLKMDAAVLRSIIVRIEEEKKGGHSSAQRAARAGGKTPAEKKPVVEAPVALSNEALEKKIEEILQ